MENKRRWLTQRRRKALYGLMFISPWLLGLFTVFAYPLFSSLFLSFGQMQNAAHSDLRFAGLANYKEALTGDTWYLRHFIYNIQQMAMKVPLINIFSIFIAVLMNRSFRGRGFYRVIFFLPVLLGSGYLMSQLSVQGIQQEAMSSVSKVLLPMQVSIYIGPVATQFITDFLSMISSVLWKSGVQIVIFLSGLQSISSSLYEAAKVDCATEWEMFWLITLPMMTPIILLNLVYTTVDFFVNSDNWLLMHIQNIAFRESRFEEAAAMSWLYFLWVILFICAAFLIMRPFVNKVKE